MKQLLLIDDEETILFALKRYLGRLRYRVDSARELEEAEALIAHTCYDLVIADLSLTAGGSTEGLEILRFVQAQSPVTKVILLTAFGTPALVSEARRRGACAVLSKPMELRELARVAGELLGGRP
jgi:DNA-binding NtrC family response regulator